MRVLLKILFIGALVLLGSCKKHQPTVKYVTDPLIYDYLMKYDKGTYWVMETTHKDSTLTQDTIFVKDAKCNLHNHADGDCEDDEPKTCDYDELLQCYLESPTIPCYMPLTSSYFGVDIGCGWGEGGTFTSFYRNINGKIATPSTKNGIFSLPDTTISGVVYQNAYRVQIHDCQNKKYGRVYFTRENGFFLWVFDDFTARLKSSKIILRPNLCRNQ